MKLRYRPRIGTAIGALVVLGVLGGFLWKLNSPATIDRYEFLQGRSPERSIVTGPSRLTYRVPGENDEHRVYCWQEDWRAVKDRAKKEFRQIGFSVVSESMTGMGSSNGKDTFIHIGAGRPRGNNPMRNESYDPNWVTVIISSAAPDNMMTKVRVWISPQILEIAAK